MEKLVLRGLIFLSFPLTVVSDLLVTETNGDDDLENDVDPSADVHGVPGEVHNTSASSPSSRTHGASPVPDTEQSRADLPVRNIQRGRGDAPSSAEDTE